MNLTTMITRVREKLDEASAAFWSDTELTAYINKGYYYYWQWLVQAQHPSALTNTSLSIVGGTATVALPADFIEVRLLERAFSDRTEPLKYRERYDESNNLNSSDSANSASFTYRIESTNLVLEPTPQSSVSNGLKLTYFYTPTELSGSNTPSLPSLYHNILVDYAVVQAKRKEENEGGGGTDMGSFLADLKEQEVYFKDMIERSTLQRMYVQPFIT